MNDAAVGFLFFAIVVQIIIAAILASWAGSKGQSGGVWFLLGLIFGPFALLFLAITPDQKKRTVNLSYNYPGSHGNNFSRENTDKQVKNDDFSDLKRKWSLLKEVDPEIREASQKLSNIHPSLDDEACKKYFILNSKEYLQPIVNSLIESYVAEREIEKKRQAGLAEKFNESALKYLTEYEAQLLPGRIDKRYKKAVTDIQQYNGSWVGWRGGVLVKFEDGSHYIQKGSLSRFFSSGDDSWK